MSGEFPSNNSEERIIWSELPVSYGLSKQQESYLFGDESETSTLDSYFVWRRKISYAREWLAAFVPDDAIPGELIEEFETVKEAIKDKEHGTGYEMETYGVEKPHPVAYAMRGEQGTVDDPDSRPILFATIDYAREVMESDPLGEEKINYALALFKEHERKLAQAREFSGESINAINFPNPVL